MSDAYRIQSEAQLRERLGNPSDVVAAKVVDHIDDFAREYIQASPFLVLSTANAEGEQDASPKGDAPGFVWIESERTIVIPDRKGNKLLYGLVNILENPQVGVLFMVPGTEETLRINGRAELTEDPTVLSRLAARGQDALLGIRIHVDECFGHCAKAFRRSELWQPETWKPIEVSFGRQFAKRVGRGDDAEVIRSIDDALERSNQEL